MAANLRIPDGRQAVAPLSILPVDDVLYRRTAQILQIPAALPRDHGQHFQTAMSIVGEIKRSQKLVYLTFKRAFDITGALLLSLILSPVLAAIALLVKLSSDGPVLFKHIRLGKGGEQFWCYKFRTMRSNAQSQLQEDTELRSQFEENFKLKDDPRITPLGHFLRRTSLDELPQFWNVLKGDMSLIGPRPIVPPELVKYGIYANKLLSVVPGLSGLWQACGRSDTSYETRIHLDMLYVDEMSLLLDLKVTAMTISVLYRQMGAY